MPHGAGGGVHRLAVAGSLVRAATHGYGRADGLNITKSLNMNAIFPLPKTRYTLPIADEVRLVTVETARAVRGLTAEAVITLAEDHLASQSDRGGTGGGHLPAFDFNLGARGRNRDLRVWAGALCGTKNPGLEGIIADCLLTSLEGLARQDFHIWTPQLERMWCVSNQKILRLIGSGEVKGVRTGHGWKVNRFSAAAFLRRRAM